VVAVVVDLREYLHHDLCLFLLRPSAIQHNIQNLEISKLKALIEIKNAI
jgi:hypothetical protein